MAHGARDLPSRLLPDLAGAAARDFEAGAYLQDFLVATVVAILVTRVFLGLTGFPRMGGGGLHVAHMLWGGLLMLIVLVLVLAPGVVPGLEAPDAGTIILPTADTPTGLVGAAASTASSVLSLVCVMLGVARLHRSRLGAYRWLERSVLVSVLVGQVLVFWEDQLAGVVQLGWNLLILAALRYAIRQEEARQGLASAHRSAALTP